MQIRLGFNYAPRSFPNFADFCIVVIIQIIQHSFVFMCELSIFIATENDVQEVVDNIYLVTLIDFTSGRAMAIK